jgi:TPR repeat protein
MQALDRVNPALWYLNRSEADWIQTDQDLERRVQNMAAEDVAWVEHLAEGGNVVAQTQLALYPKSEPATARAWLRKAANAAFPVAQTALARLYLDANGVAPNASVARHLLEQAALAHYPPARHLLQRLE